jgi:hypothetical protein
MSDLTITVEPVAGFEGYPLACAVHDPKELGLLHQGVIRVGESKRVPLPTMAECRVRIYLPSRRVVQKRSAATSDGGQQVTFQLADDLRAERRKNAPVEAPFILVPPGGSGQLALSETPAAFLLGPDPFLVENPVRPENSALEASTFPDLPASGDNWQRNYRVTPSPMVGSRTYEQPGVPFVLRPFVRLWKRVPGQPHWRVDPASCELVTDGAKGQRRLTTTSLAQYCLEIGTPSGPNSFVYLPPAPLSAEIWAQGPPLPGVNQPPVELRLRSQPLADLVLAYSRAGALGEARAVAEVSTPKSPDAAGANTALVLAYFCLRILELDRVENWLNQLIELLEIPEAYRGDIHVIEGWQTLRSEHPDVSAAQDAFVRAGLDGSPPVYT